MAKLTEKMIKDNSKIEVSNNLQTFLEENDAIQIGDYAWAILTNEEHNQYTTIELKAKNRKSTKVTPAFDPIAANENWLEEKEIKEQERLAKEKAKARKRKSA